MGELRWLESWIRKVAPTGGEAAHESVRKHIHEARGEIDSVTGWDDLQSDALGCAENALQRALQALAQEHDPVHARWELVARAFDTSTTGRSERILQDLGLPDDEAWKPFEWHVDQALAGQQPLGPADSMTAAQESK